MMFLFEFFGNLELAWFKVWSPKSTVVDMIMKLYDNSVYLVIFSFH